MRRNGSVKIRKKRSANGDRCLFIPPGAGGQGLRPSNGVDSALIYKLIERRTDMILTGHEACWPNAA